MSYTPLVAMIPVGYGTQIDALCQKYDINYTQLAKILDINRKTVYSWVEGGRLSVDHAVRIADFFHVSLDYLVYGKEK